MGIPEALMEDFESTSRSLVVISAEEFGLGGEVDFVEADLISPADEIGEEDVEGEVLLAGVLVGLGREKARVVGIGTE